MAVALESAIANHSQRTTRDVQGIALLLKKVHPESSGAWRAKSELEAAFVREMNPEEKTAMRTTAAQRVFTSGGAHEEQRRHHARLRKTVKDSWSALFGRLMAAAYGEAGWSARGRAHQPARSQTPADAAARKRAQRAREKLAREAAKKAARETLAERRQRRARWEREILYLLECDSDPGDPRPGDRGVGEGGYWHWGKTKKQARARLAEHQNDFAGVEWTRRHRPMRLVEVHDCTPDWPAGFEEDMHTIRHMHRHGIDYVRGGMYANPRLSQATRDSLERAFVHAENKCYNCRSTTHLAGACSAGPDLAAKLTAAAKAKAARARALALAAAAAASAAAAAQAVAAAGGGGAFSDD